jgi:hypothetical protein
MNFIQITCGLCHISFYLKENHVKNLEETQVEFFCPNGHKRYITNDSTVRNIPQPAAPNDSAESDSLHRKITTLKAEKLQLEAQVDFTRETLLRQERTTRRDES